VGDRGVADRAVLREGFDLVCDLYTRSAHGLKTGGSGEKKI
jgi:hypothetical protein